MRKINLRLSIKELNKINIKNYIFEYKVTA